MVRARLVLPAVVELRCSWLHLSIGQLDHLHPACLDRVQPPVGPQVEHAQRLRRWRVRCVLAGCEDNLVDTKHRDIRPSPLERGLFTSRLVLEDQPFGSKRLLLDSCLHLCIGHCRLAEDGEVLGTHHQHGAKHDLFACLTAMDLLTLYKVADCDLVLENRAGLDDSEGFRVFRQSVKLSGRGLHWHSLDVRHLSVPDEGASRRRRWPGLLGPPLPGDLHLAPAKPGGPLPTQLQIVVGDNLVHILIHVLQRVLRDLRRHVASLGVLPIDHFQLVAKTRAFGLHGMPNDGSAGVRQGTTRCAKLREPSKARG
mmetsp:Transcript_52853/g.114256  ORF Transcript_52853/g.114256 Transcript_52853/m.114256 type:complete len:312 (-) Transcript_52853:9-944(-)